MDPNIKPYYKTKLGSAYLGDALSLMKHLSTKSVDLVLSGFPFSSALNVKGRKVPPDEYDKWLDPYVKEIYRILKNHGNLVSYISVEPWRETRWESYCETMWRVFCKYFQLSIDLVHDRSLWRFQKPSLFEELNGFNWISSIEHFTEEEDKVLDPFGGTNTVGAAAEKINRKWMCFEIREDQLKKSIIRFGDKKI